ncbi:[FeFe] hydrogenase, group A [Acidaminobacterium chupaoyuni]
MSEFMMVDNIPVEISGEQNILAVVRKAGIELPTFCYYSELSVYGACRMCMVEDRRGGIHAACSTPPKAGMEIFTNTPRLRKYRKNVLELLLASHCRDCTTCEKSGKCKLQELAHQFGIRNIRFGELETERKRDDSSVCITRDNSKCILCGDCVRMCEEIQGVGAIDFAGRGSKMRVMPAFDKPIAESNCVGCGQCAAVCPTGAIVVKDDTQKLWRELSDPKAKVVVQIAPAVRVGISHEMGLDEGANAMGKITAALRRLGFDEVYDTTTGADLTVLEEAAELAGRLAGGEKLPLFTSCCPAWVNFVEKHYPELMPHVSTCRSPMEMFGAVLKEQLGHSTRRIVSVAVMPCTAKKFEASREEFIRSGAKDVDYVITTQELITMIREAGIVFDDVEPESTDMPFGVSTGAGVIFGVTGGVTEAVIRRLCDDKSVSSLRTIAFNGVRGMEGVKETTVEVGGVPVHIAIVSGLGNAKALLEKLKNGECDYQFVEVMACPGGCVSGAGQPFTNREGKKKRGDGLYQADRMSAIKRSEENYAVTALYDSVLSGRVHELLHVEYGKTHQ